MFILPHDARARQSMLTRQSVKRPAKPRTEEELPSAAEVAPRAAAKTDVSKTSAGEPLQAADDSKSG